MSFEPKTYVRKPFEIEAILLTEDNMSDVAKWCEGEVQYVSGRDGRTNFIKVKVLRPLNERQTRAFVGDWVLKAGSGFRVYTQKAFENCFETKAAKAECAHNVIFGAPELMDPVNYA